MKKILTILSFIFAFAASYGQAPKQLNAYNPQTQVNFLGTIANDSGLVFRKNYPDTTTANFGWIKNIPNVVIVINDTLYKRSNDATGWSKLGSGGGPTIYTGDGSLSGDRLIELNNHQLQITQNGNNFLYLNPILNDEYAEIRAYNSTGDGNYGLWYGHVTPLISESTLRVNFNDNIGSEIELSFDGVTKLAEYTADTHTFNSAGREYLKIDGLNQQINLMASPDGDIYGQLVLTGSAGNGQFNLQASDNVHNTIQISGNAAASSITYQADTHTFNGNVNVVNLASGSSPPVTLGIRQGVISDDDGLLSFTNKTFTALTYSATIDWNYTDGYNRTLLLTGDASLIFSNVQDGDQGTLIVIQDGTGGHALTVPDQVVTLNTGPGDTTVLGFINQGGVYYWASSVLAPTGVTSVSGTTNRITSTGGTTPVIDISASYVGQSSIVTTGNITSGGMGTGAVLRGVTMTLGSDATGDVYYRNSGGVLTRLGIGTASQTLHVVGGLPAWRDTAAAISGLTVGTTTITSGTNGRVLYDNSGILGEMTTTGSGTVLALATSPVLVTPTLGVATATTINGNTFTTGTYTLTGAAAKTLTFNNSITLTGTDATTMTFPTTTATIARTDAAQTFTGVQTFSSAPVLSTGTLTANSVLSTFPSVAGTVVEFSTASISSSSTPTPTGDSKVNELYITSLAANPTFAAPSGTPTNGNIIKIRIKDSGTARTLAWNATYIASSDLPLPTTTIINKTMYLTFIYNSATPGWNLTGMINNFGLAQIFVLSFVLGGLVTFMERKIKKMRVAA